MQAGFLTPYQESKVIAQVQKERELERSLFMTKAYSKPVTTLAQTINIDHEHAGKNLMGQFVAPQVDASLVATPTYHTQELRPVYIKEAVVGAELGAIAGRLLGANPSQVTDLNAAYAKELAKGMAAAIDRIDNVGELMATMISYHAKFSTQQAGEGTRHPNVMYDFKRPVLTNTATTAASGETAVAALLGGDVSEVDLTRLNASATGADKGGCSWDAIDGSTGVPVAGISNSRANDPVLHVQRMVNTVRLESGSCAFVVMSSDAYSWYLKSLMSVKYKDLRDTTMRTPQVLSASLLETMQNAGAVTHVGFVLEQSGISPVPIFINNSTYVDRSSGVLRKYAPEGHVLAMPPKSNGLVFAARILHPLARYEAKRLWINTWTDAKTGLREWELHSSILVAPANPKAMVSWRVCSTAYQGE